MAPLSAIVNKEIRGAAAISNWAFASLDETIAYLPTHERAHAKKRISLVEERVKRIHRDLEKSQPANTESFSLQDLASLHRTYINLESALPSREELDEIAAIVQKSHDSTKEGKIYNRIQAQAPVTAVLSGAVTGIALMTGFYSTAATCGTAFAISVANLVNPSPGKTAVANYMMALSSLVTAGEIFTDRVKPEDLHGVEKVAPMAILLATASPRAYSFHLATTAKFRDYFHKRKKLLTQARDRFDGTVRYGVIIEEARRNLRTVNRIKSREESLPHEVQDQINKLEDTLEGYIAGTHTYKDVVASRIHYSRAPQEREARQSAPRPLLQVDYHTWKANEKEEAPNIARRKKPQTLEDSTEQETASEPSFEFALGTRLERDYRRGKKAVGGFDITSLLDLTVAKLAANPEGGTIIRTTTAGGKALRADLLTKNNLPADTALYKMNPISSLRALYARQGNQFTVLDVMTHPEYDARMS